MLLPTVLEQDVQQTHTMAGVHTPLAEYQCVLGDKGVYMYVRGVTLQEKM